MRCAGVILVSSVSGSPAVPSRTYNLSDSIEASAQARSVTPSGGRFCTRSSTGSLAVNTAEKQRARSISHLRRQVHLKLHMSLYTTITSKWLKWQWLPAEPELTSWEIRSNWFLSAQMLKNDSRGITLRTKGHTVATRVSFKAVLRECEKSCPSSDDRAHLQRWAADDRAEEVWHKIERAALNNKLWLPAKHFITEILGARRFAMAIGHRGKWRERFRNAADEMERTAKFLRNRHPYAMPP